MIKYIKVVVPLLIMIATALYLYNGLQSNPEMLYWIGLAATGFFDLIITLANNPEFTGSTDY